MKTLIAPIGLLVASLTASCGGTITASQDAGPDVPVTHDSGGSSPGPLSVGPHVAVPAPAGFTGDMAAHFGAFVDLALDEQGDPGVAYIVIDPDHNGDASDTAVFFTAWDRTQGIFTTPVQIAVLGTGANPVESLSVAYDASTHTFGVAYPLIAARGHAVGLSTDRGATWTTGTVEQGRAAGAMEGNTCSVSLVLAGGTAHVAYLADPLGIRYVTGAETANPATWTRSLAPAPTGGFVVNACHRPGLAVDGAGHAFVAYWTNASNTNSLMYWQAGAAAATGTIVSATNGNGLGSAALGFQGAQIRAIFQYAPDGVPISSFPVPYFASTSTDGATWSTPTNIPADPGNGAGQYYRGRVSSLGRGAVAYQPNTGSGSGNCGKPKLSLSSDFTTWTTCSPDADNTVQPVPIAASVTVNVGPDASPYVAFGNLPPSSASNHLQAGIVVWRLAP